MPAAAFTMAITVILYAKSTIRRAKYQAELERERQLELFNRPANTSGKSGLVLSGCTAVAKD